MEGKYDTKYVGNHGIAYNCDVFPHFLHSDIRSLNHKYYENVKDGDIVYVTTSAVRWWLTEIYPNLKKNNIRIILVTGDSDVSAPLHAIGNDEVFHTIVREGVILHWFAQNIDIVDCDFVSPIPIGIDFHTIHRSPHWGEKQTHYSVQDKILDSISHRTNTHWNKLKNKVLLDAHLTAHTNFTDRNDAYNTFKDKKFAELIPQRKPRTEFWEYLRKYKFIVSPLGNGTDCHRTWEAIVLGVVPIVKKTYIYPLLKDFPILFVNSYDEVTESLLESFQYPDTFPEEKLTLNYWNTFIRNYHTSLLIPRSIPHSRPKALICGCIRNVEDKAPHIKLLIKYLQTLLEGFDTNVLLIESDSTDNTVQKLSTDDIQVISLGKLQATIKERTQRIAVCRNYYLQYLSNHSDKYDYLIIFDPDNTSIQFPHNLKEIITKYVGTSSNNKFAGIFGNSKKLYDVWALRNEKCNYDCWVKMKTSPGNYSEKRKKFIDSHQIQIPKDASPINVDSAFNGLGIYWVPSLTGTYYHGYQLIQLGPTKYARLELCEHVHLNTMLRIKREKLAIIPELYIGDIGNEHII